MNPKARHQARYYALQALYQWHLSQTPLDELEIDFLTRHVKRPTDIDYFKELIKEIPKQTDELDEKIRPYLKRSLAEIDPIELTILRLSSYELLHRLDIPYRVIINEGLELTKQFGSVEGYKFVNSVLDQVAKEVRAVEIKGG